MATGVQGGDRVEYQCKAGYQTSDPTVIACLSNNTWEQPPICSCKCVYHDTPKFLANKSGQTV